MGRALVVGCGYVGTALGRVLALAGWRVWGARRDPGALPPEITPVSMDVSRGVAGSLPGELGELDLVAYMVSADERSREAYRSAYVEGIQHVLRALAARAARDGLPRLLLYASSTAVYGGRDGAWVDEETPLEPSGFREEILLEGERTALGGPLPAVVVRLGGIYGPGRASMIERVRAGEARCPTSGPVYTNRIHRDDAAGMLLHLASTPRPAEVYLGVDRDPASICTIYGWLASRLGVPAPQVGNDVSIDRRRRANKRCSSARIAATGYTFRYPSFRDGYGELLHTPAPRP